jgi:hypothetical protein
MVAFADGQASKQALPTGGSVRYDLGMFSISKLLTLVAIIGAVFTAFRLIGKMKEARDRAEKHRPKSARSAQVEDLVRCKRCDRYVAPGATPDCGHGARCPQINAG